MVIEEGTAEDGEQAFAVCTSMWEQHMSKKAGARHNRKDKELINDSRVKLRDIDKNLVDLGAEESAEPDENAPADNMPADMPKAKAFALTPPAEGAFIIGAVKASGEWQLDVLAIPYGGPKNGRDSDGQYFSQSTQLYEDRYPSPLVVYYHGYGPDGVPQGQPEVIGEITKRWTDGAGRWVRVKLDRLSEWAQRVWAAAAKDKARASSGSIAHLVRVAVDGLITHWPFAELSLFDISETRQPANAYAVAMPVMKATYSQAGIDLPEFESIETNDSTEQPQAKGAGSYGSKPDAVNGGAVKTTSQGDLEMDEKQINDAVAAALKAQREADAAEAARKAAEQERVDAAVKAEKAKWEAEAAKGRRLPIGGEAPYQSKFADTKKFDNLDPGDNALLIDVLQARKAEGRSHGPSEGAYKALAFKLEESKEDVDHVAQSALKATGLKANELNYSTQSGYGDEWVGVAYSTRLWEAVRQNTFVGAKLLASAIELPQGMESIKLPLEGADMTWYKVAQATANTSGRPDVTVTASKVATAQASLSLVKMGARVVWSGEMEEDSLIPFVANLRRQLEVSAAEQLEHAVIDGDTETGASTNINDIAATPAGTEVFLLVNGFRKSPLVTTTANSRSAGSLTVDDYLETVKLMGLAGKNAVNKAGVSFITDLWTGWKTLSLPEILTRDVFSAPTIENGALTGLWGYSVYQSAFMHYANADATYGLKANTAGKTDLDTAANNTTGAILAVRWDQWQMGIRRRLTIETQRIPEADATQIVALMRWGLTQRDTEASSISYNISL